MMKRNILYLILPTLLLAACDNDDSQISNPAAQTGEQIRFEISFTGDGGLQTKTSTAPNFKTQWETGDEIGIFAVKHGEPLAATGNSIHNMKITFDGTDWNGAYWPNDGNKNENLDFYAYYPYDAAITDPTACTFSVKADQRTEADYNASDLLLARTTDVPKSVDVILEFSHALSLVQVEVKREVNMPPFDDTDFSLSLTNVLPGVSLGWDSPLAGTGTPTSIVMHKVDGMNYTYRALVPAQRLAADSKVTFVQTTAGKEIDMWYCGVQSTTLAVAAVHKHSVTLGWGIDPEHVYKVGDRYPHVGPAIGIVYETSNGGKNGKAVSLVEGHGPWGVFCKNEEADGVEEIRSIRDGRTATRNMIAKRKDETDFAANYYVFNWIYQTLNGNDQDGVWYMPAREELRALYNAYGRYGKTDFDNKLTSAGGMGLTPNIHWSSSEDSELSTYVVDFTNVNIYNGNKSDGHSVRGILAF